MTISIDSNVIAALWDENDPLNIVAEQKLTSLLALESLVVSGLVYSELMAGPLRDEAGLDLFFGDTGIKVDWDMDEEIWREAGRAYCGYARRRKSSGGDSPRRILVDFLIGAHALVRGHSLLTIDYRHFAAAFPTLTIIPV
jgi:predicted nucleic acid-binding protein